MSRGLHIPTPFTSQRTVSDGSEVLHGAHQRSFVLTGLVTAQFFVKILLERSSFVHGWAFQHSLFLPSSHFLDLFSLFLSLTVSVSDFLSLPPPPSLPFCFLPSFLPSPGVGGGLVTSCCPDHFFSRLTSGTACSVSSRPADTLTFSHTHTDTQSNIADWTARSSAPLRFLLASFGSFHIQLSRCACCDCLIGLCLMWSYSYMCLLSSLLFMNRKVLLVCNLYLPCEC